MNKTQCKRFIRRNLLTGKFVLDDMPLGCNNIKIGSLACSCPGFVNNVARIWINPKTFWKLKSVYQRFILLHEIGHLVHNDYKGDGKDTSYREYAANMFAYNNRDKRMRKQTWDMFRWWLEYKPDEIHLPYIRAAERFMRENKSS